MSGDVLFSGWEPDPPSSRPKLSPDRRRTTRQLVDVQSGVHPLTRGQLHPEASTSTRAGAPVGLTCGSCALRILVGHRNRTYPKCEQGSMSHSAASDVRAWWPACPAHRSAS